MQITHIEIEHGSFEIARVKARAGNSVIIIPIPNDVQAKIEALTEPLVREVVSSIKQSTN